MAASSPTPDRIYTVCAHCNTPCWPRWTRTEPGEYIGLCAECRHWHEQDFTTDNAIAQAQGIVRFRLIELAQKGGAR